MKILIIRAFPTVMNLDTYNIQEIGLARALAARGHECGIIFYNGKAPDKMENFIFEKDNIQYKINIYWLKGYSFFKNGFMPTIKKIIHEYDVIQVNEYDQITSWMIYTRQKKPTVIYHGPYYHEYAKGYNLKCRVFDSVFLKLRKYSDTITLTKSEPASEFIKSKGFKNVYTVGVGIDADNFQQVENTVCPLDYDKNKFRLLYVGKIEKRRNIFFLLDVFEKLEGMYQNIQLVIVGDGDFPYIEQFQERIKILREKGKIIYISKASQKEIGLIYQRVDLFVFTSNYEIFGMVLLEAMYFSIPVISSWNGGASVLIEDGINGFIIDEFELEKWVEKISFLINNKTLHETMKENASNKIRNYFLWDKLAVNFLNGYNKAIKEWNLNVQE